MISKLRLVTLLAMSTAQARQRLVTVGNQLYLLDDATDFEDFTYLESSDDQALESSEDD